MKKRFPQIIYEDDYLFAINKPPRMASVPGNDIPLAASVLGKIQREFEDKGIKLYLLHRLDYETSGVLLFGKHQHDRQILKQIFQHPETRKKYVALVKGIPRGAHINKPLKARASNEKIPALTNYKILKIFKIPACALVEAEIKTGRRHQIRQHFASIGCPIILDSRYGDFHFNRKFRLTFRLGRLFLHGSAASFYHPMLQKIMTIKAPLPPDLQIVLKRLNSI